jgi:hypothetical protein
LCDLPDRSGKDQEAAMRMAALLKEAAIRGRIIK